MDRAWPQLRHHIDVDWIGGIHTVMLSPEQAAQYTSQPAVVIAEALGCPISEYLTWLEWQGRAQCQAKTKTGGRQCRLTVPGVMFRSPGAFARYGGGYCEKHGGIA